MYARLGPEKKGVPPHSVISVDDFRNARDLTDYLTYLANNFTEYSKYLEWKKHYTIEDGLVACQLCKKLNEEQHKVSICGEDLHGWWWGKGSDICLSGKELPKIVSDLL